MGLGFEEISTELDMEFVLERKSIPFRHTRGVSGEQLNIKTCPYPDCRDSRWRTYYGVDTGRGNCFVCGRGFNLMGFINRYFEHGDAWRETIRTAEEILREQGWRPKREAVAAVEYGTVELPVSYALPLDDGSNINYLTARGFDGAVTKYFGLRMCEYGWWKFRDAEGAMQMQNFANRIIVPVFDLDGTLKTFQGRDVSGQSDRKYLFPKELPGTGRYLLNGQNVLATDHVVMSEGIFDVMATKVALDQHNDLRHIVPVGSFGKHLSYGSDVGDDQLGRFNQLRRAGLKLVTVMWDGERAALLAALDAAKLLRGVGLACRIALLPAGKDPNEVSGSVVVDAFRKAQVWTPALDIRYRLRNPFD